MGSLSVYRHKRHFDETPEPKAKLHRRTAGHRFVIQKHDATRLHYDFRLEIDGVLKSWAVPKGPSLNPAEKRLAMETEDHPLEYADFEGVIPEGHYGAGPVMIWDRGTFTPEGDTSAAQQYRRGELKFALNGQKLHGSFVLVKLRRSNGNGKPWLLIKHRDAAADPHWKIDTETASVTSGRNLQEVEEGEPPSAAMLQQSPQELAGAQKAKLPAALRPMLATLVDKPFSHKDWLFEIKWDGIRALAWIEDGHLKLRSRMGKDITRQYPELHQLPGRIHAKTAILDGEIVTLDENGRSSFQGLQSRMNVHSPSKAMQSSAPVTYYIFDILYCDGYDLRDVPLIERKRLLQSVLESGDRFAYADHQLAKGRELFDLAREQKLEGIIGKRVGSLYTETRSPEWVKFKVTKEVDAVIGGYTAPRGSREHFGALLLGLYDGKTLHFIGGVGTGFDRAKQKTIHEKLVKLASDKCPFEEVPKTQEKACWVEPALVARAKYASWTKDRRLRAPVFLTLLEDHQPANCQFKIETPAAASQTLKSAESKATTLKKAKSSDQGAPSIGGRVLSKNQEIEKELFHGRADNLSVEIGGKPLRLTNLNKVYFPESSYTKRDLLAYYFRAGEYILPFLKERPLVLRRYPDGISGKSFFQKDAGKGAPEWMETVAVASEGKGADIHYFLANDLAALLYLTNLGCIDHNPWSSRRDDLDHPDYVFFDLDPSEGTDFKTVVAVAQVVHEMLLDLGLKVFLKTSGATGFHLYVPLKRKYTFEQVRAFAEIIARLAASKMPKQTTQQRSIARRPRGTVMIDADQNAPGRPLAAPYAVRAVPRARVSAPISARELRPGLQPDHFTMRTILGRIEKVGDLWTDFWKARQGLENPLKKLNAS
jgi:bifunctional non-homologous end joining protein LigD